MPPQQQRNRRGSVPNIVIGGVIVIGIVATALFLFDNTREKPAIEITDSITQDQPLVEDASEDSLIPPKKGFVITYDGPTDLPRSDLYGVMSANRPLITRMYFNPLDVWEGEEQNIVADIRDEDPVIEAEAIVVTDNETNRYPLELAEGTELDGLWSGTWEVTDTHASRYEITVRARTNSNESEVKLEFD